MSVSCTNEDHSGAGPSAVSKHHILSHTEYMHEMGRSKFCIMIPGTTQNTPRLTEAFLAGAHAIDHASWCSFEGETVAVLKREVCRLRACVHRATLARDALPRGGRLASGRHHSPHGRHLTLG